MKTVSDQFDETLAATGVKRIYGIVGDFWDRSGTARWPMPWRKRSAPRRRSPTGRWCRNGTLGFVELEQKSTGFLEFGTELDNLAKTNLWR
jgi:hypothetical protein